jgi:ferredoxin
LRAEVDPDKCTACGLCADACPEVFAMSESVAEVVADPVPPGAEGAAREAAEGCPVGAITVQD